MSLSKNNSFLWRIVIDVLVGIGIILLPWWASLLLLCSLLFYFDVYGEAILGAFFIDAMFGAPVTLFLGSEWGMTFIMTVLFVTVYYVKLRMRMYA